MLSHPDGTSGLFRVRLFQEDQLIEQEFVVPSVTTTVANTKLVGFFGSADDATFTAAASLTERTDLLVDTTVDVSAESADATQAAAGASGSKVATASKAAINIGQLVALKPSGTITLRAVSSAAMTPTESITIAKPAGVAADDVLVAAVVNRDDEEVYAPAGWTLVRADKNGTALLPVRLRPDSRSERARKLHVHVRRRRVVGDRRDRRRRRHRPAQSDRCRRRPAQHELDQRDRAVDHDDDGRHRAGRLLRHRRRPHVHGASGHDRALRRQGRRRGRRRQLVGDGRPVGRRGERYQGRHGVERRGQHRHTRRPSPSGRHDQPRPAAAAHLRELGPRCRRRPGGQRGHAQRLRQPPAGQPAHPGQLGVGQPHLQRQGHGQPRPRARLATRCLPAPAHQRRQHGHVQRPHRRPTHVHRTDRFADRQLHASGHAVRDPDTRHQRQRPTGSP